MSNIDQLNNLTDIDFVDTDVDTLLAGLIADYETEYKNETGETKTLAMGDPVRILLYANAARIYGILQSINNAAKQNLLKCAAGDYLDQLGARIGATRLPAAAASATVRFTLSAAQTNTVTIPAGTRVAAGNVYFATIATAEVPPGNLSVDVTVKCAGTGMAGNGFTSGQINVLVDPIQYVASVANTDTSQGGSDAEDDGSFRERIFLKPESFSVAGPAGAYEYFVKEYSAGILDVAVGSPADGEVDIYIILEDGRIPGTVFLGGLQNYLSADTRRPLTDKVSVHAPAQVKYNIDLTYYIKTGDSALETSIQAAVDDAVKAYIRWQKSKIGRDIDPGYLQHLLYTAGAKRVVINAPTFTALSNTQVAAEETVKVQYGGLEDE